MRLAIIGGQWGDEGKGKVVDWLSERFRVIVRFQGGANAGHTVKIGNETHFFHLLPSGMIRPDRYGIIANGVVVSPPILLEEMERLEKAGVSAKGRLMVSERAHLVMPWHRAVDRLRESAAAQKIGTTQRGIGPAYEDKAGRRGIRVGTLRDLDLLKEQIAENVETVNRLLTLAKMETFDATRVFDEYAGYAAWMAPLIADTGKFLNETYEHTLFEGAQGTLLDIDHGTYPYVTSSNASIGGLGTGTGVSPRRLDCVLGIFKAYATRVGEGPFPSELKNETGDSIRNIGREFGTTTGRPRRCGWFDAVAAAYAARVNGFTHVALTLLDVLDSFDEVGVCTGYRYKGTVMRDFPAEPKVLAACEPEFRMFPGWKSKSGGVRDWKNLPQRARDYVHVLEEALGAPVSLVSTGPERECMILRESLKLPPPIRL